MCVEWGCTAIVPAGTKGGRCPAHQIKRDRRGVANITAAWRRVRAAVLERDEYTCRYCGAIATTADHIIPLYKGGAPFDLENLAAACMSCNSGKGHA